ncbi:MAG TPA: SRPBCC family protein [Caulobacteraceae bacterium]|nr:SRPBCC family protein [Caulobacteraceae bacterium]
MAESRFLYVTYIRAPAQAIWDHLTSPELNKRFWHGYSQKSTWAKGADYAIVAGDGEAWDTGKVLACEPPKRLSVTWTHQKDAAMKAEGESVATFDIEPVNDRVTKLTVTHTIGVSPSKFIEAVSTGWPSILANLKSLLETGSALEEWAAG